MAINNYYHITDSGAGDNSGDSWANAMALSDFETHLETAVAAGDVHFVMDGTYTFGSTIDCSARNGTSTAPIAIIGVKSGTTNEGSSVVYSDWSVEASDKPFFDTVTYQFRVGNYYIFRNFDCEGGNSINVRFGDYCIVENCKFNNDAATSASYAVYMGDYGKFINNEVTAANTQGLGTGSLCRVFYSYFHDLTDATHGKAYEAGSFSFVGFCIFDNCGVCGLLISSNAHISSINNVYYETEVGVSATTGQSFVAINDAIEGNDTSGFSWSTQTDSNFFWKNHGDDTRCTDMWVNVDISTIFQDYEVSTGDPKFTTPGSDFSLQSGSPLIEDGMSIILGVG